MLVVFLYGNLGLNWSLFGAATSHGGGQLRGYWRWSTQLGTPERILDFVGDSTSFAVDLIAVDTNQLIVGSRRQRAHPGLQLAKRTICVQD